MIRFNKLGLDKITGEEPNPSTQVEEVHSYNPVQSAPLNSEKIVYIDIGTAHSVAVTGKIFTQLISDTSITGAFKLNFNFTVNTQINAFKKLF